MKEKKRPVTEKLLNDVRAKLGGAYGAKSELAKAVCVSPGAITQYLSAQRSPSYEVGYAMQRWLDGK